MNFVNQIKIMLIYLLLFNHQIFGMMQNNIALDLDKEYTNLLLLSNFDSVKKPGIEEDQIVLERRMQFRLIAWNFAEKYGLEKEKKKITKGKIEDMIKYACELWTKTVLEEEYQKDKIIQGNPELEKQSRTALRKQFEESPISLPELLKIGTGDCPRLEFHLDDKSDPYEEMPKWVDNFFLSANQMHLEKMTKLLRLNNLERDNFEFWWKKIQKRTQEVRDEEELKKSLELEDAEAKMGRSKAIVLIRGKMKEIIPLEDDGSGNEESQFLREMRKLAINSITKDGQEVLKLVKRQIIKMTSANTLMNLERFHPTLLGIGIIEEQLALALYKNVIKKTNELELIFWEFRISATIFHGRIWRKLFEKLFDNRANNEEDVRVHFLQLFEISKKFNLFKNSTIIDKINAQKMCLELWRLWRKIMGEDDSENEVETREEHFEENRMKIRNELLWKEHWAWLDLLKKMDKQLLDSNFSPGNIYKFSEFFGGFEQIWSKIIEMEKSGQKPFQLDGIVDTENENFTGENFIDKMLAPFRTKLNDLRIIYNIEDCFMKILIAPDSEAEDENLLLHQFMWKTSSDIRRVIWGLDLLIWMLILDEQIDQISTENDDQKLVNAWWNVRVEMEIFHDSLAIRAGGFEGVKKPALYMLNWMYLLKHQKCITKTETSDKTQIGEFDKDMKEKNREELNKNIISYINKCKKMAKEHTEKERKHFDKNEMYYWRWFYLDKLISKSERFYSSNLAITLENRIEKPKTMKRLSDLIGSEFLAEISEKSRKSLGRRYMVEKWIEIFQIPDKNIRFQASLDFIYLCARHNMDSTIYYSKKHQLTTISFQREFARNVYDGIVRIEEQVANVLGKEKNEENEGNIPTIGHRKNIEKFTTELNGRQINIIRSIKMIKDLERKIEETVESHLMNNQNYSAIEMVTSEFVLENFHQIMEELRNFYMTNNISFVQFAHVLKSHSELKELLINEVGTVYRLNILLGYNEVDKKRNIEIIWEEASKGENRIGSILANPLRDINFFNDKRLKENYMKALKNYKVKGEISPTIMYSLAANILVFMQHFEQFVMRSAVRKKYGEQIRLFARIEYDKLLTDFGQVNFRVQREFFAQLLAEIKNTTIKEISEILSNYRLEKIAVENENDKLFVDYDEHLQKLHYEAFLRLVWQEKEVEVENKDKKKEAEVENKGKKGEAEVENKDKKKEAEVENKGKKEVNESSIAKILIDANSVQSRRQILFNFMGNFERIANVFNQIGKYGIKIHAKNYAHFVKGEGGNEQHLRIASPETLPPTKAENLVTSQHVGAEIKEEKSFLVKKVQQILGEKGIKKSADIHESIGNFFGDIFKKLEANGIIELHYPKVIVEDMKGGNEQLLRKSMPTELEEKSFLVKNVQQILGEKGIKKAADIHESIGNFFGDIFKKLEAHGIVELHYPNKYAYSAKGKENVEVEDGNEQNLRKSMPAEPLPLPKAENLSKTQIVGSERREPPAGFKLLRREPPAESAKEETSKKKSWADMADSENSDTDDGGGVGKRKNVQKIQEIVEVGNEQQQQPTEEIGGIKKLTEGEKKEIIKMTAAAEEATSSNTRAKGKKKKKVRFQSPVTATKEEASSNSPSPSNKNEIPTAAADVVDVPSGDAETSNSSSSSKSKKKREKQKLKKIEKQQNQQQQNRQKTERGTEREYGKITILKRDENKEAVGEMVELPSIEILKGKMQEGHKLPSFENYFDDQFLYNKILVIYENFIAEQKWSPEEHLFLTVGIYLNEIGHKFAALKEMKKGKMLLANSIDWKLVEEMQRELAELKLNEKTEWTLEEMNVLMAKLHDIFTKLFAQIDGYSSGGKEKANENEDSFDQMFLRLQLNFICFARAICEKKKLEQRWTVKDAKIQTFNRNFVYLLGHQPIFVAEHGQNKNHQKFSTLEKLKTQFEKEYLTPYKQMLEQNIIDHQLLDEYWPNSAPKNAIPIDFNKLGQQFRWSSEQIRQSRGSTQQIRDTVYNVVVKDEDDEAEGPGNRRRYQHVDFAIDQIEHIITKIWAPQSTLKIGGAYQLGTWTTNSEINAILIASKRVGRIRFFGKSTCESNRRCSDIDSLFCQLCQNKNIFHLIRHPNNHIPHIKFTYCTHFERHQMDFDRAKLPAFQCAPFELVLVSLPGYGIISERTLQNTQLLIDQFRENGEEDIYEIDWNDSRAGMIHALSGYQLNEFILSKLMNKHMLRVFRISLVALKKWAEKNHIYGGRYGFMNGASLGLMLLKIVLRFPLTPMVPFILEQFFTHFVNWPWPMPVQFAPLGEDRTEAGQKKLGWQAEREKGQKQKMWRIKVVGWQHLPTLTMPIISPCKPERNVAYSVNHSTQQIIQRQLQLGLEMIVKIREQQYQNRHALIEHHEGGNAKKFSWKSLLNGNKTFGEKYTHYIVFYCFAKTSSTSLELRELDEKFCGEYVLYQLRLQLIFSVERNPSTGIMRCHILPNINMEKQQRKNLNELSKKLLEVPPEFRNLLNRYWVIGLEFVDGAIQGKVGNNAAAAEQLENWLNKSQYGFVEKFIQDYIIFSMRKHSRPEIYKKLANIHLYAKFVPADQLGQWIIQSQIWRPKE